MDLLKKLQHLEKEAAAFGFRWDNPHQIIDQINSECLEVQEHLSNTQSHPELQEEIGDLLHAVFSLCVFCQFSPEETLRQAVGKFERRFNAVKQLAAAQGVNTLEGSSFSELMHYWDEAKAKVG